MSTKQIQNNITKFATNTNSEIHLIALIKMTLLNIQNINKIQRDFQNKCETKIKISKLLKCENENKTVNHCVTSTGTGFNFQIPFSS